MTEQVDARKDGPFVMPRVNVAAPGAPWRWLSQGLADMRAAPGPSLFYGAVFAVMGALIDQFVREAALELALVTGFLLVAPFLAMGLYDISRQRQLGQPVVFAHTLVAWQSNAPSVGFYALILALLLAVWIRVSVVVVALFFTGDLPFEGSLLAHLASTPEGWVFMASYAAAGAGFALFVFATTVVSIPMLRDWYGMDTLTAMITSFNALRANFGVMVLWAVTIVLLVGVGFFTWYVGLVVTAPVVGHASWHAYRECVSRPSSSEGAA
ncbi:MAG: DUF2189 domain-containing protein [Betaproteobacteria bacterium]|nr:DUF2189 domain-containing protein [Betaproteobacteria bacterium]